MLKKGLLLGLLLVSQLVLADNRYTDHEARRIQRTVAATGVDMHTFIGLLATFDDAGYHNAMDIVGTFNTFHRAIWRRSLRLSPGHNDKTGTALIVGFMEFLTWVATREHQEEYMDVLRQFFPFFITEVVTLSRFIEVAFENSGQQRICDLAGERYQQIRSQLGLKQ